MKGRLSVVLLESALSLFIAISPCISSVIYTLLVLSKSISGGLFIIEADYYTIAFLFLLARIP